MDVNDFDSKDEFEFARWLLGMERIGLVEKRGYHPTSLMLSEKVEIPYVKQLKTKQKECQRFVMHPCSYQADFVIQPNTDHVIEGMWFGMIPTPESGFIWTDTKGAFSKFHDQKSSSIIFKWVYQVHGIIINKVVNKKLFHATFAPDEIRIGKSGKELKAWRDCPTIEEFKRSLHV